MSQSPRAGHDPAGYRRARAAAALRRLGHALVSRDAPNELLERVTTTAERAVDELESAPPRERDPMRLKRRMFHIEVADGERVSHYDDCYVSGACNPLGIAIEVRREGEEAVAEVELGRAFEGAPGRAHGGIVAAVFDDVLGYLLTLRHSPGFTAELTVHYLHATPIGQPLIVRARVTGRQGRELSTEAEAHADGIVVAQAQATFLLTDDDLTDDDLTDRDLTDGDLTDGDLTDDDRP